MKREDIEKDISIINDDFNYKVIHPKDIPIMENMFYKDGKQKRRERRKQERDKKKKL